MVALLEQLFVLISFTYFLGGLGPNNALYNVLNHVRCKVPKGGSSGETGIPWQPIGVEPGIAKTAVE